MKARPTTYRNFLEEIGWTELPLIKKKAAELIDQFRPAEGPGLPFQPASFLLDYSAQKYLHVDEGWLREFGYSANWFLERGLQAYLNLWHPDDMHVIDSKVYPDLLAFYANVPETDYKNFINTYNYRMLNGTNECRTALQIFSFIPYPGQRKPAGAVGVAFDITHYKTDNSIVCTIKKKNNKPSPFSDELVFKKTYPVFGNNECLLSKKELQILKLMGAGMASKQIANELSLSIFTINNHRKNMLYKTGCRSASELISFAATHGLL